MSRFNRIATSRVPALLGVVALTFALGSETLIAQKDPGPRRGAPAAGEPLQQLNSMERTAFLAGQDVFIEENDVQGTITGDAGLGPRFNLDSCGGCHAHPAVGGSSPPINPQIAMATKAGARNRIPRFLSINGPVREARLVRNRDGSPNGGVAALFTIAGRRDAPGCGADQPDFDDELRRDNVIFRIPTPLFGMGLIEAIDDSTILANMRGNGSQKSQLGISGRENRTGNDGTITRFGWKAQNKSLLIFSGEAYNVEQGVTSDMFLHERDSTPGCSFTTTPEDHFDAASDPLEVGGDVPLFSVFMRFLAPPQPAPQTQSTRDGARLFEQVGCALCHTPTLRTGRSSTAALSNKSVNLYSDLVLHKMGRGLADGVSQGLAAGDEFRTAPLWGLGQRLFFLHDGRADDLMEAIAAHASQGSEANSVIGRFNDLSRSDKQDVLDFLRSL